MVGLLRRFDWFNVDLMIGAKGEILLGLFRFLSCSLYDGYELIRNHEHNLIV